MAGNSINDRYIVYYNSDTVFLNVFQSGSWTKKTVYAGNKIVSATMTFYKDTIWICWKEGIYIKAGYTNDKGKTWSKVMNVSPAGNVASPSVYASNNGKIHFTWSRDTIIYHNVYNNGTFLPESRSLSNLGAQGQMPSVIAIGDTVLATWREGPLPTKVWFRSSFDRGQSWNKLSSAPTTDILALSKDPNIAYSYDSATSTHYVYLAFDGQNKIYLQRSTDLGNSWSAPEIVSNTGKLSQFAHIESNNKGFVGISYEQRPIGSSLYDDTKKDVGFTYSTNWGKKGTFSMDTLAYTNNGFGSAYPAFNKIDENNFYLAWLTKDTISNKINVLERLVSLSNTTGIDADEQDMRQSIGIFPNPFSMQTILQVNKNFGNSTLTVYNSYGQAVKQIENLSGSTITFYRDNLPVGVYFARLTQNGNIIMVDKLLIID